MAVEISHQTPNPHHAPSSKKVDFEIQLKSSPNPLRDKVQNYPDFSDFIPYRDLIIDTIGRVL